MRFSCYRLMLNCYVDDCILKPLIESMGCSYIDSKAFWVIVKSVVDCVQLVLRGLESSLLVTWSGQPMK